MIGQALRHIPLFMMLVAVSGLPAAAQTLGDLAKKPDSPAPAAKGPSRSFSDKDLKASPGGDGVVPIGSASAMDLAPPGPVLTREEIVRRVMPAVVTIQAGSATGSGFLVAPGLILTNHHVVGSASMVRVRLSDGSSSNGLVSRVASDADLALVKVDGVGGGVTPMVLGSYRQLQAGQDVVAIGSSLGVFQNTVTRGIVSAVRRNTGVVYVQTDAAINPGNSGGPLVDQYGRAVGINTSKMSGAESIGFAIAIDHARRLINGQIYVADRTAPDATRSENANAGGFNGPAASESDERHQAGLAEYDNIVRTLAGQADNLDAQWKQYAQSCGVVAASAPSGGRTWFAIWTPAGASGGNGRGNCSAMQAAILTRAGQVNTAMQDAGEGARRTGVYPGEARDVRRRYSLDYDGW